jgi:hypothetical protein
MLAQVEAALAWLCWLTRFMSLTIFIVAISISMASFAAAFTPIIISKLRWISSMIYWALVIVLLRLFLRLFLRLLMRRVTFSAAAVVSA